MGGEADLNFYASEEDCRQLLMDALVTGITFHPFHRSRYSLSSRVGKGGK